MTQPETHVIRLRAGWRVTGEGLPCRRFHRPTGIDHGVRVWLVIDDAERLRSVLLNEEPIELVRGRSDVTRRLETSNELLLEGVDGPPDGALLRSVRLEITAD